MATKRTGWLILILIVCCYTFMYTSTNRYACGDDCEKVYSLDTTLRQNRDYVYWTFRCSRNSISDTLCVNVKDTTGINWDLFADTVCLIATQKGLTQQKIFIIKNGTFPADTVARKQCP